MKYPYINESSPLRESLVMFGGYDHNDSINEGMFYDIKNMTTANSPVLSTRAHRGKSIQIENYQGILDKEKLVWVDNGTLYIDGEAVPEFPLSAEGEKKLYKMGAYIVIFPDKKYYNTSDSTDKGDIEATKAYGSFIDGGTATEVTMRMVSPDGSNISLVTEDAPSTDGVYRIFTSDGKKSLKVWSKTTKMWVNVATTYFKITCTGIGTNFKKGDGVKVSINLGSISWSRAKDIFVNDDGDGKRSSNFVIKEKSTNSITIVGLLDSASVTFDGGSGTSHYAKMPGIKVERLCPDMSHICECQNRLWGCATDGHEVYCCKLGDVTNWNCFDGVATDSWTATVGSDGEFTGAFAYMGYPIFFKEKSLLKISISSYGGHSYKEIECRGVQRGSDKSLVLLNELLYYKGVSDVCVYDGNFPQTISEALGGIRYKNAVGGSIKDRYYINMQDESEAWCLFVYDTLHQLWCKEDSIHIKSFCRHEDDLFFVAQDNYLYSVYGRIFDEGSIEGPFFWEVESGNIGYQEPDKKYLARFDIRMSLDVGTDVSMFVSYDSSDKWEFVFNMSGKGTKTFAIPVRPKRCDHFRWKLKGHGDAKLISVTKEYEEGSDI